MYNRPAAKKSGAEKSKVLDPGNLMLLVYPLAVLAFLLLGRVLHTGNPEPPAINNAGGMSHLQIDATSQESVDEPIMLIVGDSGV